MAGRGREERGHVLFDFVAEFLLDGRVRGEEVQGPGDAGGGGVVAGAEEGHDLVAHGFEAEFVARGGVGFHVVAHDESDDVFVFGVRDGLFFLDDFRRFAEDDVARRQHVAVHFRRQVFGQRDKGREAVQDARGYVKGEDEAVGFADRGLGVFE